MPGIFISYRRDDSAGHAGRLFDRLAEHFGPDRVFMDVVGIEAGVDFAEAIDKAVSSAEVMVAVIGRNWLTGKDRAGNLRLSDPKDFIRLETAMALGRGIRVVPVLVQGAAMPAEGDLPEDIAPLARRQAVELSDSRWDSDVGRFVKMLEGMTPGGARKKIFRWAAMGGLALAVGGYVAWQLRPISVPDLVGKPRDEARASLLAARLTPGREELKAAAGGRPGMVIEQQPAAGERASKGSRVNLVIAGETAIKRGEASLSIKRVDFGGQTLSVMSEPQSVTVINSGGAPLAIGATPVEGAAFRDYTITHNDCLGASLDAGKSCAMRISFTPSIAGSRSAELVLRGESMEMLAEVALSGIGNPLPAVAKSARILRFSYASNQLCYAVADAVSARIEPGFGEVQPAQKSCQDYRPETARTLTLTAVGEDGKEVARQLTVKAPEHQPIDAPKPPRCKEILLRSQIGAPLSAADRAFLQKECKS